MFETYMARVARAAERRAAAKARRLAARLEDELPGVRAEAAADGVRLSGRGLARRLALDPALRRALAELIR